MQDLIQDNVFSWRKTLRGGAAAMLMGIMLLFGGAHAEAATVTFAWDPPAYNLDGTPITATVGYRLYYGSASGQYDTFVDAGSNTLVSVSGLDEYATYFFSVKAYNDSGAESDFAQEVSWCVRDNMPPIILTQPADAFVTDNQSARFWVTVDSVPDLSFQWRCNGSIIPGATNAVYALDAPTIDNDGDEFDVLITSVNGSTASAAASLTYGAQVAAAGDISWLALLLDDPAPARGGKPQ